MDTDRVSLESMLGLFTVASLMVGARIAHADDAGPSGSEIRARYTAALASLESIEVIYDFEQEAAVSSVLEADGLPVPKVVPLIHVRVLRQPGRWRNETTILASEGGPRDSFAINSFDGSRAYVAYNGDAEGSLKIARVGIRRPTPERPPDEHTRHIDAFLGVDLIGLQRSTQSLATLLEVEPGGEPVADDVAGHPCWRVQLGKDREVDGKAYKMVAWFDPAAGWLIRKLEGRVWDAPGGAEVKLPGGEVTFTLFVDEFIPVSGAASADAWFPESAVLVGKYSTNRLRVKSVQSARDFTMADFVPTIPVGAEVAETLPDKSTRSYRYGVRTDVDAMVRTAAEAVRAAAAEPPVAAMPGDSVVTARAARGLSWVWVFLVVAVAAGLAATYLKRHGA